MREFLQNINNYYIHKIKNKSFVEYIYFKESEKAYEIADHLRNNEYDKLDLKNEEILKIIISEFNKNIKEKGAFSINSFVCIANLIAKNNASPIVDKLITKFWINFIKPDIELRAVVLLQMELDFC
ncbi:hypothetical protein ACX8XN_03540 [Calditrichota bacterium GD2]